MASKYELSISTGYVKDWGIVEAIRELFQNAIDNEIVNPENKMEFNYNEETHTLVVSNKTSVLKADSLLLGSTTKDSDNRTIGQHGEGYKIAFMVLLRNGKQITVHNYGLKEIWKVELVNSRRYKAQIPTVYVNKEAFWEKVPNNNLEIIIQGIVKEEYDEICNKNLNLRPGTYEVIDGLKTGRILTNKDESGNIYVKGLYVGNINRLTYGYDFIPEVIKLDRDRKVVDSFDIAWEASKLWIDASKNNKEAAETAVDLVYKNALDVQYVTKVLMPGDSNIINNGVADKFYEDNGEDAVPVVDTLEYNAVIEQKLGTPIIVDNAKADMIKNSSRSGAREKAVIVTVRQQLEAFMDKIEPKLDDEEIEEFEHLINKVAN